MRADAGAIVRNQLAIVTQTVVGLGLTRFCQPADVLAELFSKALVLGFGPFNVEGRELGVISDFDNNLAEARMIEGPDFHFLDLLNRVCGLSASKQLRELSADSDERYPLVLGAED